MGRYARRSGAPARGPLRALQLKVAQGAIGRQAIASDRSGNLYVATERGLAVGTASSSGFQFELIGPAAGAVRAEAHSAHVDSHGVVWYGCGKSLCQLREHAARGVAPEMGLPLEGWDAILTDLDENLWARSEHSLYVRPQGGARFEPRAGVPNATNTYPTLALDPLGRLLVTTNQGLARHDGSGWELVGAAQGLTSNDLSAVVQDREGSIWLGLLGSGLARWLGTVSGKAGASPMD